MRTWHCAKCGATIQVMLVSWPLRAFLTCPSREACEFRRDLQNREPPEPIDYDPEPDDIHVCSLCRGAGEYIASQDWESGGLNIKSCPTCEGSGIQPRYTPALDWP